MNKQAVDALLDAVQSACALDPGLHKKIVHAAAQGASDYYIAKNVADRRAKHLDTHNN